MSNEDVREMPTLEARLEAANAKAESARAKRNALATETMEQKVCRLELEAADEEALYLAEEEHGRNKVGTIATEMGLIIVKRAPTMLFKRFQDRESVKTLDIEKLCRPCVVYPTKARFDEIIEAMPATLLRVADRVSYLAGVRAKDTAGK